MVAERLSALDASFLEIEEADDCSHMHVGWAMVFGPAPGGVPDVRAVRRRLAERLSALPRFSRRLSSPRTGGLSWPMWEDDPNFDFGAHIRHATLPSPGDDAELLEWLGDFYSHRLDRTRPLWEITLLDGLVEGQWALVVKAHHCLVDGVSGAVLTALLLDSTPDGEPAIEPPAAPLPAAGGGVLRGALGALVHPRRLFAMLERSRALADLVRREIVPAPVTSLNVEIGASRRLAALDVPLDTLKAIKRALGGTVNDVALAIVAGGLRELVLARGEDPPARGLRTMVPVNVRGGAEAASLGNRVSSLFVDLPVAEPDALERHAAIVASTGALKRGGQAAGTEAFLDVAGLAPPVLHALVARLSFTPRLFNVTVTNVMGSPVTLYALGAPMRRIVPLVPIFAYHAVGIAVVSYDGGVTFGINADRGAVRDVDRLVDGMRHSLAELEELARLRRAGAHAPVVAAQGASG